MTKGAVEGLTYLALLAFIISGIVVVSESPLTGKAVGSLSIMAPGTGSVKISVTDKATGGLINANVAVYSGARLITSGGTRGDAAKFSLQAGSYAASVSAYGYKPGKGTFTVEAGATTDVMISLQKTSASGTGGSGTGATPTPTGTSGPKPTVTSRPTQQPTGTTVPSVVKEEVKCVFDGAKEKRECYSEKGRCTGVESCVVDVSGKKGEKITWKSTCGGYAYSVIDGDDEYAEFKCGKSSPYPTQEPFCGNGICEKSNNENSATCPEDCKADPQQKCVDSEKYTKDPFDTGTVTIYKGNKAVATYKEKCNPDGSLIEYYCIGNEKAEATMYCGPGYQCSNGACKESRAPATAGLQVTSNPSKADVYLNDEFKGTTPVTVKSQKPGTYSVTVTKDGYYEFGSIINLESGRTKPLHAKLIPLPKPTGQPTGTTVPSVVKEEVKCVFYNSKEKQECSSEKGSCSGIETCIVDVSGKKGEKVTWKSTCGGYADTVIDGEDEYAEFKCAGTVQKCTDSDGGLNYYVKGKVTAQNVALIYEDRCAFGQEGNPDTKNDRNLLFESYCFKDGSGYGYYSYSCPNGCADGKCEGTPSSTTQPTTQSAAYVSVKIAVADKETGNVLDNARVYVYTGGGRSVNDLTTGGAAEFSLRPGSYSALASASGYTSSSATFTAKSDGDNTVVIALEKKTSSTPTSTGTAAPTSTQTPASQPIAQGSAKITVVDKATDEPLKNARIYIYNAGGRTLITSGDTRSGFAEFRLRKGSYQASVSAAGYISTRELIAVTGGDDNIRIGMDKRASSTSTPTPPPTGTQSPSPPPSNTSSPSPPPQSTDPGSVKVIVRDRDLKSVNDAKVELLDSSGEAIFSGYTKAGVVVFPQVKPGSYTASVTKEGFKPATKDVTVEAKKQRPVNIDLEKVVSETNSVKITVTGPSKLGLENARVEIYDSSGTGDPLYRAYTTVKGEAFFPSVAFGNYMVSASAEGYVEKKISVKVEAGAPADKVIRLESGVSGTGLVRVIVMSGSEVLKDVDVRVEIYDSGGNRVRGKDAVEGIAEFTDIEAGSYTTKARAEGYEEGSQTFTAEAGKQKPVTVNIKKETTGTRTYSIKVVSADDKPIENARVEMVDSSGNTIRTGRTGAAGSIEFSDVPLGTYTAKARAEGYKESSKQAKVAADKPPFVKIRLEREETGKGSLEVTVFYKGTRDIVLSGTVYVYGEYDRLLDSKTISSGSAIFPELAAGEYKISTGYYYNTERKTVTIRAGEKKTETLEMEGQPPGGWSSTGNLTVTVTERPSQKPVPNARVILQSSGQIFRSIMATGGTAVFSRLQPADYDVYAEAAGYKKGEKQTRKVEADKNIFVDIDLEKESATSGSATITVTDSRTGSVIYNAVVKLTDSSGKSDIEDTGSGSAVFENKPAGKYTASAEAPGYKKKEQEIGIVAGRPVTPPPLIGLERGETGTGSVRITIREKGVNRIIRDHSIVELKEASPGKRLYRTETETGTAAFDSVAPGDYRIIVTTTGYRMVSEKSEKVELGKPKPVEVEMEKGDTGTVYVKITVTSRGDQKIIKTANVELLPLPQDEKPPFRDDTASGAAVFSSVPPGDYKLTVTADGYNVWTREIKTEAGKPVDRTIELEKGAGQPPGGNPPGEKPPAGSVRIIVEDVNTGEILTNAGIEIHNAKGQAIATGTTKDGYVEFGNLSRGLYGGTARAPGYSIKRFVARIVPENPAGETVTVRLAKIQGPSTRTVTITVVGAESGEPINGARVSIYDYRNRPAGSGETIDGIVEFHSLKLGYYTAVVKAAGYKDSRQRFAMGGVRKQVTVEMEK